MCSVCGMRYCPSGCPNSKETPAGICAGCGETIWSYEEYRILEDGELVHEDDYCKCAYVDKTSRFKREGEEV